MIEESASLVIKWLFWCIIRGSQTGTGIIFPFDAPTDSYLLGSNAFYVICYNAGMNKTNPSKLIDKQIADLADWRGKMLARLRKLVREADPDLKEEWKWNTAVRTHDGLVCAAGAFKDHIKINFFKGASLEDPHKLFNAGLEAKGSRAIDFHEGDDINESALKDLVRAAVAYNQKKK